MSDNSPDSDPAQADIPHSQAPTSIKTLEAKARRVARHTGLRAIKSRNYYIVNRGGFRLIDCRGNTQAGPEFELDADAVIHFCYCQWPEVQKFALGASARYDDYLAGPADPVAAAKPAKVTLVKPAQFESGKEARRSQLEVELEEYRKWRLHDPEYLEQIPQPVGVLTFKKVFQTEFGYKNPESLSRLAKSLGYPERARLKGLTTGDAIQLLKEGKQAKRNQQKHPPSPAKQKPGTTRDKKGQTKIFDRVN
jgi:hypothetical protein